MPTIHLSLPEQVYNELREYADEMGMQVTSLVKMLIRDGLEKLRKEREERRRRQSEEATKVLLQVLNEIEQLRREFQEYKVYVEGELFRINTSLQGLKKRVSRLEDTVEEQLYPVETEVVSP